ncbi:hypothetical protein [Pseudomonas fragi]|uniref:hypothetical protein n=1 Tax=Pseudomonas fragi TaxID=296 RepID=UPI001472BDD6|nr:hypothetical protein [Pseudomonas fragi]NNB17990.1 hypothetical protein [Pseudomonas fragi]NNB22798.1 hypothetical protein [Pseudomonas fragi]
MTISIDTTEVWRTIGLALSALGGCALGVFFANSHGFSSENSSAIVAAGVFIIMASFGLRGLTGALAVIIGPMVFGVGISWVSASLSLSPTVAVFGMVMVMAGFILRIFNDY